MNIGEQFTLFIAQLSLSCAIISYALSFLIDFSFYIFNKKRPKIVKSLKNITVISLLCVLIYIIIESIISKPMILVLVDLVGA